LASGLGEAAGPLHPSLVSASSCLAWAGQHPGKEVLWVKASSLALFLFSLLVPAAVVVDEVEIFVPLALL